MAGSPQSKNAASASSPNRPKPGSREKITFTYPKWLADLALETSTKYGAPFDALAKVKTYDTSKSSPFLAENEPVQPRLAEPQPRRESRDLSDEERQRRRLAKVDNRARESNNIAESSENDLVRHESSSENDLVRHQSSSDVYPSPSGDVSSEDSPVLKYHPLPLPKWYEKAKIGFGMKSYKKNPKSYQTQARSALMSMKGCMDRCEKKDLARDQYAKLFEELRDHVHKAEILLQIDKYVVCDCNMLNVQTGLPRIFAGQVEYPWDLKADAYQLYSRWRMEVFEIDLLRGIISAKTDSRTTDSLDKSYKGLMSAKFYGQGHLVLGQWWPTQLTAVRDGAHGAPQSGIFGEKGKGAYSIVLSGMGTTHYDDKDHGNEIWYSGTDGTDGMVTENTLRLIETCDTVKNMVRVLRSSQLNKQNPYRPEMGLRYDGLYEVVGRRLANEETKNYTFHLVRCMEQFPIRCAETGCEENARRPTRFEIEVATRLKLDGC